MTTVTVINKATLSDGAIAVTLRPNNDPSGDSVATLYVTPATTSADIQSWLTAEQSRVAAQYDAMQAAHAALASL